MIADLVRMLDERGAELDLPRLHPGVVIGVDADPAGKVTMLLVDDDARPRAVAKVGRRPGGPSRWSRGRETMDWEGVRPELVCEVAYEKLQSGERFRHAARFLRWRPDKPPEQCGFDQVESVAAFDLDSIFAVRG